MNGIIEAIKQFIEWFKSTPLPKDTAEFLVDVIRVVGTNFLILMREYIDVFFPGI